MTDVKGIPLVPEPTEDVLSERQCVDYRHHRERLIKWMFQLGKDSERGKGYAWETVRRRATNLDMFYRWVWEQEGKYTTAITRDHGNDYIRQLAYSDHSDTHKSNLQKTLQMYFRWRSFEFGDGEWVPPITFHESSTTQPRDYLTREERREIREAALEYGSVPHYNSLSPSERQEWKATLAQRFDKPMQSIGKTEFKRANGYKIPSLVWTSLDAGLRPIEVSRATPEWVDTNNAVLRIPVDDAAKSKDNWTVSIQRRTADALRRWIEERQLYPKYDGSDLLWLTREGNPYGSTGLKYILRKLCDLANIDYDNRQMTWYTIRHSVGTFMSREEGLAAAQAQLRHKNVRTTMKYDNAPVEDRRNALTKME